MTYVYRTDHIPKSTACNRRPGIGMAATTLTVHNTGNEKSTAANERAWLTNPTNTRTASYHIVVDEKEAIEVLPLNEVGWHAGDGSGAASGNRTSIGIEICESGDYERTLTNTTALVAKMLYERGWDTTRLRRHYDWSGKICPRLMYDNGSWRGWAEFVSRVKTELERIKKSEVSAIKTANYEEVTVKVNGVDVGEVGWLTAGVTRVPVRKVAELFNAKVTYDPKNKTVNIERSTK